MIRENSNEISRTLWRTAVLIQIEPISMDFKIELDVRNERHGKGKVQSI